MDCGRWWRRGQIKNLNEPEVRKHLTVYSRPILRFAIDDWTREGWKRDEWKARRASLSPLSREFGNIEHRTSNIER